MNNKFLLILMSSMLLGSISASAAPVDPATALGIARDFAGNATARQLMRKASSASPQMKLVYTHADKVSGQNAFYVFNRGASDGYVLVSADDRAPAILGYNDSGTFDPANIPASMQPMMADWSRQIQWLATHPQAKPLKPLKAEQAIEPLLGEIAWDQGKPYNTKCPTVTLADDWGYAAGKGAAPTGCVATALGQIMYYHKWPLQGKGSISYVSEGEDPDGNAENINVDVNFEGCTYNWDAMLPQLTTNSPSDAVDAVSTLLFHAGAAFQSVYGGLGTGATDVSVAPAMLKYFGYDNGINYVKRDYYSTSDWHAMIMNEFENRRPVAYGGVTRRGEGHFFVLDGVNTDGYYHVNWGWSGQENGYYLLTLLEPGSQGIGGSSDGSAFHYAQNMITGIQKPVEGSQLNYCFTVESLSDFNKTIGRQETATLTAAGVWNDSPNQVTANLGFALIDKDGNTVYRQMVKNGTTYDVAYGENELACSFLIPDNIASGEYTLRPVYQLSVDNYATDRLMQVFHGRADSYKVSVTENNITYATQGAYSLSILEVKGDNDGDIESGVTTKITLKVHNDGGEFYGPVQLRLFINGKDWIFGKHDYPSKTNNAVWLALPANADTEVTFDLGDNFNLPGHDDYVVRLWGNEGLLSDQYRPISFKNLASVSGVKIVGPALPPVVELVDDIILTTMVDGKVPMNDVGLKICLDNDGGEWTGSLRASVDDPDSWSWEPLGYVTFDPVTIPAETAELWLTLTGGELPAACQPGKTYELTIYDPIENEAMIPSNYMSVEFTAGEAVEKEAALSLDDLTFEPEAIVAGKPTDVQFHVSNSGYAYNGEMSFTVSRAGEVMHTSAKQSASVGRDDEAVVEFTETFELPTASDYVVTLLDNEGKEIGKRENITFTADAPALSLTEATSVPSTVKCNEDTEYTFGVMNTGFRFDSSLRFVIVLSDDVKYTSEPQPLALARGEEGLVKFKETVNIPDGDKYLVRLLTADDETVGECNTSITGYVGIDSISLDNDAPVRYFNLQGIEITAPEKGQTVIIVKGSKSIKAIF